MPPNPVTPYAVDTAPAITVSGAAAATEKNTTDATPSRLRANVAATCPARRERVPAIIRSLHKGSTTARRDGGPIRVRCGAPGPRHRPPLGCVPPAAASATTTATPPTAT